MKIQVLEIQNFRGIEFLRVELNSQFTLLIGDNGSGKTSILSALSVALGIWHVSRIVAGSKQWRSILDHEVREVATIEGGERVFSPAGEVQITATGSIGSRGVHSWTRRKRARGSRTVDVWSEQVVADILAAVANRDEEREPLPLLVYYGTGRAWLPSNERQLPEIERDLRSRRADGYYDCLNERIRLKDILQWFVLQAASRDETGRFRPGFETVRLALKRSIPGVSDIFWDPSKREVIVTINGVARPFSSLSDGQRTMAATVADLAIRAIALNTYLLDESNPAAILEKTPGVVLIDELDAHLHPKWQRRVIDDLKRTFPAIQFVCTSHSPFLIQALAPGELIQLDEGPSDTVGQDDSIEDIVEEVQGVPLPQRSDRSERLAKATERYFKLLQQGKGAPAAELAEAELEYREASQGFSTQPGLEAVLKLEALAAKHGIS